MGTVDQYMIANNDGRPTFRVRDLLDVWRIKPWFSQQTGAFKKKLEAAAQAAAASAQAAAAAAAAAQATPTGNSPHALTCI